MWQDSDSGQMGFRAGWQIEPSARGREGSALKLSWAIAGWDSLPALA
jgi:hypothetical protein